MKAQECLNDQIAVRRYLAALSQQHGEGKEAKLLRTWTCREESKW